MTFRKRISELADRLTGRPIGESVYGADPDTALAILRCNDEDLMPLLDAANRVRRHFLGDTVRLCSIYSVKSGACTEDCAFCAQSGHHDTEAAKSSSFAFDQVMPAALAAESLGVSTFSLVTSGMGPADETEVAGLANQIVRLQGIGKLKICCSVGICDRDTLGRFKAAGLTRLHHNLETARSFYPQVCSTHSYQDNLDTIKEAKAAGLAVCCGAIFGLGESVEQRVELLQELIDLNVDSVPINFLNPIPGTPLEKRPLVSPLKALKIIAAVRLSLPVKPIILCGGREVTLREYQGLVFFAGASGLMIGDYLTTSGRPPKDDLRLIDDLGLRIEH